VIGSNVIGSAGRIAIAFHRMVDDVVLRERGLS